MTRILDLQSLREKRDFDFQTSNLIEKENALMEILFKPENRHGDSKAYFVFSTGGLTARVSRLGWEGGLPVETEKLQAKKKANITRRVPQVGCTHC